MATDDLGPGRGMRGPVHVFFTIAVLCAGGMFCFKLFSFMKTIKRDELAGFAFDPIIVYGLVAFGFLLLLAWAFMTGQFKDIERAKYEMLERFQEQERQERQERELARGAESNAG